MLPDYIRPLIVILAMAALAFGLMRRHLVGIAMTDAAFVARRNAWLLVTCAAFLSNNFWIFIAVSGIVLALAVRRESNPLALYAFVMLAVPPIADRIPGLGLINYVFEIDYLRLLSLVVLVGALPRLRFGRWLPTDFMILAYLAIQLGLRAPSDTLTNTLRVSFHMMLDVWLPYYVASRSLRNLADLREVMVSFAAGAAVVAMVAVFELTRGWMLYSSLDRFFGVEWGYGNYLRREGLVRASASAGQAIVLGYAMTIALMFWGAIRTVTPKLQRWWWLGTLVLLGGCLAPLSRGPLIGLTLGWIAFKLLGPNAVKGTARLFMVATMIAGLLAISPMGDWVKSYIPFMGDVDSGSVDYRQLLFTTSLDLIVRSPLAGVPGFYGQLADSGLVQGQGIVDLVNSYVAIALAVGVPALIVFVMAFVTAMWPLFKQIKRLPPESAAARNVGAMLVGTLIATMVTIATVSSILVVPYIYWFLIGLTVGFSERLRLRLQDLSTFGGPVIGSPQWRTMADARSAK